MRKKPSLILRASQLAATLPTLAILSAGLGQAQVVIVPTTPK